MSLRGALSPACCASGAHPLGVLVVSPVVVRLLHPYKLLALVDSGLYVLMLYICRSLTFLCAWCGLGG